MQLAPIGQDKLNRFITSFPHGLCFLDLETTGLSPIGDKIIEIAIIKINKDGSTETFQSLINPERPIPPITIDIHHITDQMVKNEPRIDEVLPRAINFIGRAAVIAHNAKFDMGYLSYNAQLLKLSFPGNPIYCTCQMARRTMKQLNRHSLSFLCEHFEIVNENHHRALDDTKACMELFFKLIEERPDQTFNPNHAYLLNTRDYKDLKNYKLPEFIKDREDDIYHQRPFLMKYKGGTLDMDYRPVKPSSLLPMPSGPVLYALCMVSEHYKSFSIKKIKDIKMATNQEIDEAIYEGQELASFE